MKTILLILILFLAYPANVNTESKVLKIETLYLEDIFPSRFQYYTQEPIGRVRVRNTSAATLKRIKVSLYIPTYMDLPTEYVIPKINPYSVREVPLKATFNKEIFEVDENTPVSVEIKITSDGIEDTLVHTITIRSRNAMDWRISENIAAFVTPNDSVVIDFIKQDIPFFRSDELNATRKNKLQAAMAVFAALSKITYFPDPIMPYKKVAERKVPIDKVQYPRETLKYRKGDCDDLAVLYASCLEAIGIKTAFVIVPGHIFVIFNTEIHPRYGEIISYDEASYIIRDNYIWLPVETTKLSSSFSSAIKEGMNHYRRWVGNMKIIDVQKEWQIFPSVSLPRPDFVWKGDKALAEQKLKDDIIAFKEFRKKSYENILAELRKKVEKEPRNPMLYNRLGVILGKEKKYDLAQSEFEKALKIDKLYPSSLNNMGNIYLLKGSMSAAIAYFERARQVDPDDAGIYFNLFLAFFYREDLGKALEMLREALMRFPNIKEAILALGLLEEGVVDILPADPEKIPEKISKEELKKLLDEVLEKLPDKEASKKARRLLAYFAGRRGEAPFEEEVELRWLLHWKE